VLAALQRRGWRPTHILNTHHHADHIGGDAELKEMFGVPIIGPRADAARIPGIDVELGDGDEYDVGGHAARVFETPGHTRGHISFWFAADRALFCGDTLFALGCGRLFEGTPEMMWASLQRLAALPENTALYCAHEYTASNARFALTLDEAPEVAERAAAVFRTREGGRPTVPTSVMAERQANPMLRAPLLKARLGIPDASDVEAFAAVRAAKDAFRG
jgi:hydroxyacylglutathione hydrolase